MLGCGVIAIIILIKTSCINLEMLCHGDQSNLNKLQVSRSVHRNIYAILHLTCFTYYLHLD